MIMSKFTDIVLSNRSAENTATAHMRDRCAACRQRTETL